MIARAWLGGIAAAAAACGGSHPLVDASASDASGADSNVTADASPVDAGLTPCTKPANKALSFGGNQWVTIADAASLEPTDLTIELWAQFSAVPGYTVMIAKPLGSSTADSYTIWTQGGGLYAGVNPTSPADAIGTTFTPTVGQWYQLTFTYDHATSTQTLYIDGTQIAQATTTAAPAYDTQPVLLGGDMNGGVPGGFFAGELDEIKIWDSVRDLSQVGLDLHSCTPGSFTGLRAYWALDEGSGDITADLSGSGNGGTLGDSAGADARDPAWIDSTVPF